MSAALALIPQLIALIPLVESGASELIGFISKVRVAAQQTGEWTPAMETAFLESLLKMGQGRAWMTDAQVKAQG